MSTETEPNRKSSLTYPSLKIIRIMIRADRMNNINFEIIEMAHSFEFAAYKAIAKTKGLFFFGGNQWKPLLLEFFVRKIQPTEPVIVNTEMLKKQKKKGATGRACLLSRFHF